MAQLFRTVANDEQRAEMFATAAEHRREAMDAFLWNEAAGQWYDYDWRRGEQRDISASSNFFPLWAGAFSTQQAAAAVRSFADSELIQRGGVVGTMLYTRQQWDFPNAWPPLQWFSVMSMRHAAEALRSADDESAHAEVIKLAEDTARKVAVDWVSSNFAGYRLSKSQMFEKYDVRVWGYRGFGGEYQPQDGFGWTNGVCLSFLEMYGDQLDFATFEAEFRRDDQNYRRNEVVQEIKSELNVTKGELHALIRDIIRHMSKSGVRTRRGSVLLTQPRLDEWLAQGNASTEYASELKIFPTTFSRCRHKAAKREYAKPHLRSSNFLVVRGTNLYYWEDAKNVLPANRVEYDTQQVAVRMEFGTFTNDLKVTRWDRMVDEVSDTIGRNLFEQAVSAQHLPLLTVFVWRHLMKNKIIRTIPSLWAEDDVNNDNNDTNDEDDQKRASPAPPKVLPTLADLALIQSDRSDNCDAIKRLLHDKFQFDTLRPERHKMRKVAELVTKRAGRFMAAAIGAVAQRKMFINRATIAIENEVFDTLPLFGKATTDALKQLFAINVNISLVPIGDVRAESTQQCLVNAALQDNSSK
eukprot:TRINITY_DN65957_c4_g1_i1.p1 TRINITY_DN65957_c4_g1~~TRINITY_DN65957_c4_g1_i1.p1  ORF type:complete len:657 (+),score=363.54 TRINITY_DN65957_c4_g1_i1:226-1971(+)